MQTILGSGGAIGIELAKALREFTNEIRLVSRNPKKISTTDEVISADLLHAEDAQKAVEDSSVAYLTAGLPYNTKVWKESWPQLMTNVIKACIMHDCKLVFFDNIYINDPNYLGGMTEETPINPQSKKGKVRAEIARMVMDEVEEGKLTALIARSADFYGPAIQNSSILTETVFKPLSKGEKASWMGSVSCKRSFTYTPDAGKATALLGNTADTYNQVWHLPTAANPPIGKDWIEKIAEEMGAQFKYRTVSKFSVRTIGFFNPIMKEMTEMFYQYDRDYIFDSSKFEKQFDYKATSYEKGIKHIVKEDYKKSAMEK